MTWFRPYRWGGKMIKALRRLGVEVRPTTTRDLRISGMRIQWKQDERDLVRGAVVRSTLADQPLLMFVENDIDVLQQQHRRGDLYEPEELEMIASAWRGGTFLDVGANVGNHTLYAAIALGATKVIAVEPVESAARILELNLALNRLAERVDVHRVGLSDRPGQAVARMQSNNLGASRLTEGQGDVLLVTGDQLVGDCRVDFVKIDTEGFEKRVLSGLVGTLARDAPALFVEVENDHVEWFESFCRDHGYEIAGRFRRYETSLNLLATQSDDG